MKKYKFLFALVFGLSVIGCSNLEEDARSQLEPDERNLDIETIETTVAGAYGHLRARAFLSRALGLTLMLRSDMVDIGNPSTNAERVEHDQFTVSASNPLILNPTNPERSFWPRMYQIVRGANETLRELEVLEADAAVKDEIAGRARFIRAFSYYHLVRLFGDVPYLDETTSTADASIASRLSAETVYDNIIADFEFAKQTLPDTRADRSLPAKAAASAYLASVYLTRGEYQMAYDEATEIINNAGLYNLELEPDFRNIFHAVNTDFSLEPIFVIDFVAINDNDESRDYLAAFTGFFGQQTYYASGGWSVAVPAQAVYDTWDDADYRKQINFDADAVVDTSGTRIPFTQFSSVNPVNANRPHISKYTAMAGDLPQANTSGRDSESNYQLMRYAEVLLIAAEAAVEIGRSSEADQYINMIRERARNGDGTGSPSAVPANISGATLDDVLEERRLELSFEHKRWYDIVRRRMGDEVFGSGGFEVELLGTQNFDPARDYLLPIPPLEITNNPNLTQNPGY